MPPARRIAPIALWTLVWLLLPGASAAQGSAGPLATPAIPAASLALEPRIQRYLAAAAASLDPEPRHVLREIRPGERRALAIAFYFRHRDRIASRWTWTPDETRAYQRTEPYRRTMRELRQVRRVFAASNPGYTLVTDTVVRSLQTQVRFWNRERSVGAAARELGDSIGAWLDEPGWPDHPDDSALRRFLDRLLAYESPTPPTVAVPGLSQHGRLRAFDFAVVRRGAVVAGTSSATVESVWDAGGWTERLREAVQLAGSHFAGPLVAPREPWHYEWQEEQ